MKKLLFLFVILLAAVGLGFLIKKDPGYAMVSYAHWMVATSFWVALVCIFILFFLFYFMIRVIKTITGIPSALLHRRVFLNAKDAEKYLSHGMIDLYSGNFRSAEKLFLKSHEKKPSCAHYLLAAQAAHSQNSIERRDCYLQQALNTGVDAQFPTMLLKAQFYCDDKKYDDALSLYKTLCKEAPKNPAVLTGLKMLYLKTREFEAIKLILPQLKRQQLISAEEIKLLGNV